jgi:hypothetical protein
MLPFKTKIKYVVFEILFGNILDLADFCGLVCKKIVFLCQNKEKANEQATNHCCLD